MASSSWIVVPNAGLGSSNTHNLIFPKCRYDRIRRRIERRRTCAVSTRLGRTRAAQREDYSSLIASKNTYKMNLNEYLVTIHRPLGIRFAQTLSGKIYVDGLAKQGNAEKCKLIMVGDVLKKVTLDDSTWEAMDDFGPVINAIRSTNGPIKLILESSVFPSHIQTLILESKVQTCFNDGHAGTATWNNRNMTSPNKPLIDEYGGGNVGFVIYTWKFLLPNGIRQITKFAKEAFTGITYEEEDEDDVDEVTEELHNMEAPLEIIATYCDDGDLNEAIEWTHGSFHLQEYTSAQARAEKDLTYNHRFGLKYTKITDNVYVGSCLHNGAELQQLKNIGVSAILNLQSESEQINWGIEKNSITEAALVNNIVISHCPVRDVDTVHLRRKLPLAVGILYRMLRTGHCIYVTCTSGLDRSPACVIGYLHWIQDVPLQSAIDFVTNLHACGPDRSALVWATWDLIAMAEKGNHEGPPTHAVQFVWNHGCRDGEEVLIVGDFKGGGWNEPIKATHATGPKYTVDLRLPQGKYQYKFIVGGQWRHSNSLPTEIDRWGNVNNVIIVGGKASARPDNVVHSTTKDLTTVKVIERVLTEEERFTLAFAARRLAFAVSPLEFAPK